MVAAGDNVEPDRIIRETIAVSAGRLMSYRRLSNWSQSGAQVLEEIEEEADEIEAENSEDAENSDESEDSDDS